ncbi:MAG: ferrous iron transport protein B, partial [Verrucomicrobia bacterium]
MTVQNPGSENNTLEKNNQKEIVYALVGNPNSGKTTLFNQLTGLNQKVANYPGVTVEKKEGCCYSQYGERIRLIDLPGAYSICAHSPDEEVLQQVLLGKMEGTEKPDRIICVIDASNLERTLYLAIQVIELGYPTILALNMMDIVERRGLSINIKNLSLALGIPVIPIQANKKDTLLPLKVAISQQQLIKPRSLNIALPGKLEEALVRMRHALPHNWTLGEALLLLTSNNSNNSDIQELKKKALVTEWQELLDQELPGWRSQIIQLRYQILESIFQKHVTQIKENTKNYSAKLDRFFLHPIWGWTFLFLIMGTLFFSIFALSEYPMQIIESAFHKLSHFLDPLLPSGPLKGLILNGALKGLASILVFFPQIFMLFFFIGILESTGYLPRAAFLLDRIMNKVGLPGKSFIPLLSSFACAIPGIMATRTLSSKQERFATIMIAPWMSCSARLPIFLMLIGILIPSNTHSALLKTFLLFGIYLIGIFSAFTLGWIFRKTLFKGK